MPPAARRPGMRFDGVALAVGDKVVTAAVSWCDNVGCNVPRGFVGTVRGVHRDGTMTVSLRYRGTTFRWKSEPNAWLTFDEWKTSDPDTYKKWRAFEKARKALRKAQETSS